MLKYPKHYRIPHPQISVAYGKRYFTNAELKDFLKQKDLVCLEKLDGSQFGLAHKSLQPYLQGRGSHIPRGDKRKAYTGTWSWAWKNIEKIQNIAGKLLFGEWMRVQHNLPYDNLPDMAVFYDVLDLKKGRFMDTMDALEWLKDHGFATAPVLYEGRLKFNDLLPIIHKKRSAFSTSHILSKTKFSSEDIDQIQHPHSKGNPRDRFTDNLIYMEGGVFKPRQNLKIDDIKGNRYWMNCAKLVTAEFLEEFSDDSHWTSSRMRENKLESW